MVASARPRIRGALSIAFAQFGEQRFFIFYRDGQRIRAKLHVMGLVLRGVISFGQARELYRGIV